MFLDFHERLIEKMDSKNNEFGEMVEESEQGQEETNEVRIQTTGESIDYSTISAKGEKAPPTNIPFSPDSPIIDQILNGRGYRLDTFKNLFLTFCVILLEGLEMTMFGLMIIPLKGFFDLGDTAMGVLSSVLFVGVGVGSVLSGIFSSKFGRPSLINSFLLVMFLAHLFSAFNNNYYIYGVLRFVIGFGVGLIVPLSINLLTEVLPLKNRALVLTSVWIGYGIGIFYLLVIMYIIMPNYEVDKVTLTIILSSFLPFFTLLFNFFNLQDSPRNLIMRGKAEQGFEILEKLTKEKLSEDTRARIIKEVKRGKKHVEGKSHTNFWEIFKGKFALLTVILGIIWLIDSLVTYGYSIIQTFTLKALGDVHNFDSKEIIFKQMIMTLVSSTGTILGGTLSELAFLGRNRTTAISFIFSSVALLLLTIFSSEFALLACIAQLFWSVALNVTTTYACEVYPTHIRDHAIGFLFFATRIGGFMSQLIFIYLNTLGIWIPYYISAGFFLLNAILTFCLPYETFGKPLDSHSSTRDSIHLEPEQVKTI